MLNKENANPIKFKKILPFPVEKQQHQLSINIDDENNKLFYAEYFPLVYRRCFSILHNKEDAQDISGDVFEKVQELKSKGKFIDYPKTYLSRMAENMSKNKKKRDRRELIELYDMATNGSINWFKNKGEKERKEWEAGIIEKGYEQIEAEIIVEAILNEQEEIIRKIYFYYYHDDMSLEQIGEAVGFGKSTVQNKIKKLEKQVKEAIRGENK